MIERHFSREPVYTPLLAEILSVKHDAGADGIDVLVKSGSKKTTIRIKNPPEGLKVGDTIRFSPKGMTQIPVGSASAFARYGEAELMGGERREKPKAPAVPPRAEKTEAPRPAPVYPSREPKNMFGIYEAAELARAEEKAKNKAKKDPEKKPAPPAEPGSGIGWNSTHTQFFWSDFGDFEAPRPEKKMRYDEVLGEEVPVVPGLSTDDTPADVRNTLRASVEAVAGSGAEENESEESFESGPETYMVQYEAPSIVVRVGAKAYRITNAREKYLLPGDRIRLASVTEGKKKKQGTAEAIDIAYEGKGHILGHIEEESDEDALRGGRQDSERELVFVARMPGSNDVMEKFKFPLTHIPNARELFESGKPFVFDRTTQSVIKVIDEEIEPYEEARLAVLTMYGIEPHSEEFDLLTEKEQAKVDELYARFGIPPKTPSSKIDEAARPAFEAWVAKEIKESGGRIKDFTNDPTRRTFYIDPARSTDHDDAFSLRPLKKEEVPKKTREGSGEWYEMAIHIARPDMLAPAGSALDLKALLRATSTYMPKDETIRMFSRVISEHLGSLHEGEKRFALSFVCKVRVGPGGGSPRNVVEMRDPSFEQTVIEVTNGLSYQNADAVLSGEKDGKNWPAGISDEDIAMLKVAKDIASAVQSRTGALKEPSAESEEMDAAELVQTLMETYNRAMVTSIDRYKRSSARNVRLLQDLVLPIYRNRTIEAEPTEELLNGLVGAGILSKDDFDTEAPESDEEKDVQARRLTVLAQERIRKGGKESIADGAFKIAPFSAKTKEAYFKLMRTAGRRGTLSYSSEPLGHTHFAGSSMTRATSPLRRYADLFADRGLIFLQELSHVSAALGKNEDISEDELRKGLRTYAEKVVGIRVPKKIYSGTLDGLVSYVKEKTEAYAERVYDNSLAREKASSETEGAMVGIKTASDMKEALTKGKEIALPEGGLRVDFSTRNRGTKDGRIFGEIRISRKRNRELMKYIPRPFSDTRLNIELALPEDALAPQQLVKGKGVTRFSLAVRGTITDVDVQKGRLVLTPDAAAYKGLTERDVETR